LHYLCRPIRANKTPSHCRRIAPALPCTRRRMQ
jgi:hypothetical protein